ncbi:MAG: hypothetical protein ACREA9_24170 [Pyrinomonadaceae bacterium]
MKTLLLSVFIISLYWLYEPVFAAEPLQVTIAWKNVDTSRNIRLEKGPETTGPFVSLAQLAAGTSSYVDATNEPGTKACYRMAYYDAINMGPFSTPKCKTFTAAPTSPPSTITVK